MAYAATVILQMAWIGDGVGPLSVPSAQSTEFTLPLTFMPGGDTVSTTNTNTLGTTLGTLIQTTLATTATQALLTGWATGNP